MDECLHVRIEMVEMIGIRPNGVRYRNGDAMSCRDCPAIWPYVNPDDLPHWLYLRLKEEGRLPMPALTPRIMKALQDSAEGKSE